MSVLTGFGVVAASWLLVWLAWRQFSRSRAVHKACWALGLAFLAAAVTLEVLARGHGAWTDGAYRAWYYLGAMQGVTFIGQGTLLLVWDAPWSRASLEVVVVLALVGLCVTLAAPLDFAQLPGPAVASGVAFPAIASSGFLTPRAWTIPFNTWGTLWMVGGAAWSAWRLREKRPPRAFGTAVIAVSGLVLAGTSVLNRFGIPGLEGLGRTLGVALLFLGFSASSWREWPAWAAGAWPSVRRYGPAGLVAVAVLAALGWAFPGLAGAVLANPGLAVVAIVVLFMIGAVVQAARHPRRVRQH